LKREVSSAANDLWRIDPPGGIPRVDDELGLAHDDRIYLARIVDAYYGGSMGNPYLAGHEDAPKYMPELAERVTAAVAHAVHISPFVAAALNRVLLPTIIFLLCWRLGILLGLADDLAILAGLLMVMMPSVTRSTGAYAGDTLGFLRYFSAISPPAYVVLLLTASVVRFSRSESYRRFLVTLLCPEQNCAQPSTGLIV
jgi:hypothetical protein